MKRGVILLLVLAGSAVGAEPFIPANEQERVWVLGLEARSLQVRQEARASLFRTECLPFLQRVLDCAGASPRLRTEATWVIHEFGPFAAAAAPSLVRGLTDPDDGVRTASVQALGAIGPAAELAVPALLDMLDDPDAGLRYLALRSLAKIRVSLSDEIPAIGVLVTDDDRAVRMEAVWCLIEHADGEARLPYLRTALRDPDDAIAAKACVELGRVGDSLVPMLLAGAGSDDPKTRREAVDFASLLPPDQALPVMAIGLHDADPEILLLAISIAGDLGAAGFDLTADLCRLASKGDREVRLQAIVALGGIGRAGDPVVVLLVETSRSPDPEFSLEAVRALCSFSAQHPRAENRLRQVVEEDDGPAARVALRAVADTGAILVALRSRYPMTRQLAMELVRKNRHGGQPEVADALCEVFREGTPEEKKSVLQTFGAFDRLPAAAFDCLLSATRANHQDIRRAALHPLGRQARWSYRAKVRLAEMVMKGRPADRRAAFAVSWQREIHAPDAMKSILADAFQDPVLCRAAGEQFQHRAIPAEYRSVLEELVATGRGWAAIHAAQALGVPLADAPGILPGLIEELRSGDPVRQGSAADEVLGLRMPAALAGPALASLARSELPGDLRVRVNRALSRVREQSPTVFPGRAVAEGQIRPGVRVVYSARLESALTQFEESGDPARALELLRFRFESEVGFGHSPYYWIWEDDLLGIGRLGPAAAEFLPQLMACLPKSHDRILPSLLSAIVSMGPVAVPPAAELLDHPNPAIRFVGVRLIGKFGPLAADHRDRLRELAGDDMLEFRAEAAWALAAVAPADPDTVTTLIALLADSALEVRADAAASLLRIGPAARSAIPALRRASRDEHPTVREVARRALEMVEGE